MAAGIPNTNQILPFSKEALQQKSKLGALMELPGLIYSQYTPTAAQISSGTVTDSGLSLIGANQLGSTTAGTLPLGGTAAVTFTSSSGLLVNFTTSSFMPVTLNYDQMPVKFALGTSGVMPTGIVAGQVYYWQFASATTGRLALTPGGTAIAYTDAGTATVYCQAASQYWGSPVLPAGFLQVSDVLAQSSLSNLPSAGCHLRIEVMGHALGTTTNVTTITPGLISSAGAFTALTAGSALARVAAGPFPFKTTADIIIQQYNSSNAMVRSVCEHVVYSAASTSTSSMNVFEKTTSLDLTQSYAVDLRAINATPVVGEYLEPLFVRIWAYN